MTRAAEIASNLAQVQGRIAAAAIAAGRAAADVKLIVVTKTWPATDVRILADLGVGDVGENRDQEAAPKQSACADLDLRWHFIGNLQRNKCRSVARYADVVHSVDRSEVVAALAQGAQLAGRTLAVCLQVSLEPEPGSGRSGAAPGELTRLADRVGREPSLVLAGLMAVAPLGVDPDGPFELLAGIAAAFRIDHPGAIMISAGMSHDVESAVRHGATHVRIGTAVLGRRPALR